MTRRYESWSGRAAGAREDSRYCIAAVTSRAKKRAGMQCAIPRGYGRHGQFCHRHAEALRAGRYVDIPIVWAQRTGTTDTGGGA